jgi:hypothetical protein
MPATRALTVDEAARLSKLVGLLTSKHEGEIANSARKAMRSFAPPA